MADEFQKQKILIIDDAISNIKVLGSALQPEYKVLFALDGKEGINSAVANQPDLILLDIMMPGMNGYEVCRQLKTDKQTKDIPVIFITSRSGEEDEALGFEAGGVDYITKPFSPLITKARIKTHLELKKRTDFLEWMLRVKSKELLEIQKEYEKLFIRE